MPYFRDLVVLFGTALAVISASQRLRIPPIVGFLVTGMLVGPNGLGWVGRAEHVEAFAELGIIFLMFIIGLEVSVDRLRRLWRPMALGGSLQTSATAALTGLAAWVLGLSPAQSLLIGFLAAMSSTAIVLKIYSERREMEAPHAQAAMAILLFQDFLIVPLLVVVPVLAGSGAGSAPALLSRFGGGLLAVGGIFVVGRYLLPPLLHLIVHTRIRELLVITALFACLGASLLTGQMGLSPALGAFLAGALIAESDYRHQILAETAPFRDVFNSLFFLSVGMLLPLRFAVVHAPAILGLGMLLIALKAVMAFGAVAVLGLPRRVALLSALGLSQIGEFSFVLMREGEQAGLLGNGAYNLALASSIVTMVCTPLWIALGPRIADRLLGGSGAAAKPKSGMHHHVVIVGFGLIGRHLARVFKEAGLPYVVVDLNGITVRQAKARGEPILYGDASRRDILEKCGISAAQAAVFTAASDPAPLRQGVRLARGLNPHLYLVARTRLLSEIEELKRVGASEVIAEEFETSIEIVTRLLTHMHLPGNIVRAQAKLLRLDGYQMLRSPSPVAGLTQKAVQALAAGTTDTFQLNEGHSAVGRTIRDLDLRKVSGALIIALVRAEKPYPNPAPDMALERGDVLVLVGSHAQIDGAFEHLEKKTAA